jgi:hypothetical protein
MLKTASDKCSSLFLSNVSDEEKKDINNIDGSTVIAGDISSIVVGVVIVAFAATAIPVAKVFNPKSMLIVSSVGVSVSLFTFGSLVFFDETEFLKTYSWIPLLIFVLYIGFFMVIILFLHSLVS